MVGKHHPRLVCARVGVDPVDEASNVRHCADCSAGVWVSASMTPHVESGELTPQCPDCWLTSGKRLTLHPAEAAELASRGQLEDGWRRIGEENSGG